MQMPTTTFTRFDVQATEFLRALLAADSVASTDTSRPVLNGVFMEFTECQLTFTATDSYRLVKTVAVDIADPDHILDPLPTDTGSATGAHESTGLVLKIPKGGQVRLKQMIREFNRKAINLRAEDRRRRKAKGQPFTDAELTAGTTLTVVVNDDATLTIGVGLGSSAIVVDVLDVDFVSYRALIPDPEQPMTTHFDGTVGLNPHYIEDAAKTMKLAGWSRQHGAVRMRVTDNLKPFTFVWNGEKPSNVGASAAYRTPGCPAVTLMVMPIRVS